MKKWAFLYCVTVVVMMASGGFWQQMTIEERRAAGIDQLLPEQQAVLDQAAARFAKEGARQEVEQAREQAKIEAKVEIRQQKLANAGLASRDDDEIIRARITGKFHGWDGNTVFNLDNGQIWQQADRGEQRYFPRSVNTEVELVPSKWAGWKMTLVSEGLWVRVKRIR